MDKRSIAAGTILCIAFLALACLFFGFTLDDAFIIYRYAAHLAHGQGILWNLGEAPVEGYTSFLWMVLNAGAIRCGLDPALFSKVVSSLAGLSIILVLVRAGRGLPMSLNVVLAGAVELCPPLALLAMQGLETVPAALIILGTAYFSLRILRTRSLRDMAGWHALALIGFLARPESAAFNGGALLGLAWRLRESGDRRALGRLAWSGAPFAAAFAVYTWWRLDYFGYFFPNTFYVKIAPAYGLVKAGGAMYCLSFIVNVLAPYLVMAGLMSRKGRDRDRGSGVMPIALGLVCFWSYLVVIIPIQGFMWRFAFPVFPAFLLALTCYFSGRVGQVRVLKRAWASALMVAFFAAWTLRLLPTAERTVAERWGEDRVVMGRMLSGLDGTMFVSESGALPYFSGWRAYDLLGINDTEIAHRGLSNLLLEKMAPDLIVLHELGGFYRPDTAEEKIVNDYMIGHGFVAVAAVEKCPGQYHYFFARRASPLFRAMVLRLRDAPGLKYGDLHELMLEDRIPLLAAERVTKVEGRQ